MNPYACAHTYLSLHKSPGEGLRMWSSKELRTACYLPKLSSAWLRSRTAVHSLECFNPHRKLISRPDQAASRSINKKVFDTTGRGKKESNDINTQTLTSEHILDRYTGVFLGPKREKRWQVWGGNPDGVFSEDERVGSTWIVKVSRGLAGMEVEGAIWPYCERYRRVTGKRPVRNQLIVQNATCPVSCTAPFLWIYRVLNDTSGQWH